jgi:hypothetical protein
LEAFPADLGQIRNANEVGTCSDADPMRNAIAAPALANEVNVATAGERV